MEIDEVKTLFNYGCWATERVINSAKALSADQFAAKVQCSHGSLRGTLVHILSADWIWRLRCQKGVSPDQFVDESLFENADSAWARLNDEQLEMGNYLNTLSSNDLDGMIEYRTTKGKAYRNTLWHLLLHLFNHGTHHRSEAAHILSQYGHSPGDIDLIIYLRALK